MVIESCESKHRAQIGCLLLTSIPIFGILIGVGYFFLLDWRHMQLLGTISFTFILQLYLFLIQVHWLLHWHCAIHGKIFFHSSFFLINIIHRLIPESRRWYLNSHRVSRVNKLLQICSSKQTPTLGLNKIGSTPSNNITYDKPMVSQESEHVQKSSISWLFIEKQLRIITGCLFTLW